MFKLKLGESLVVSKLTVEGKSDMKAELKALATIGRSELSALMIDLKKNDELNKRLLLDYLKEIRKDLEALEPKMPELKFDVDKLIFHRPTNYKLGPADSQLTFIESDILGPLKPWLKYYFGNTVVI